MKYCNNNYENNCNIISNMNNKDNNIIINNIVLWLRIININ